MLTEEIKNLIDELYNVTPDYVGVGYGHKVTNGEMTGDQAIIFFVPQKKPLYIIPENEILPSEEIILGDLILKMDVVEVGEVTAFACDPSCYSWQTVPPANRQFIRPIQGGISLTSQTQLGTVGTLGFIAVDTETQALVGVTNNHVVIKDAFYTSQRDPLGPITNEYDITDGGSRNPDTAYQPGETPSPPIGTKVGEVVRYVPIYLSGGVNKVDGALISVECSPVTSIAESFKQFGLSYNSPYQFATTAEINNLLSTNPMLYSSGRTTGVKQGLPCPLRTFALGVNIPVGGYKLQGVAQTVTFNDVIQFVRPENDPNLSTVCIYPIFPGDSGSALVANFGGVSKIIGLCFAGSAYYGFACRIDHVAAELGIEEWDGTSKPVVDPDTIDYITVPGENSIKLESCSGETYWQVGSTTLNKSCSASCDICISGASLPPIGQTRTYNGITLTGGGSGYVTGSTVYSIPTCYSNWESPQLGTTFLGRLNTTSPSPFVYELTFSQNVNNVSFRFINYSGALPFYRETFTITLFQDSTEVPLTITPCEYCCAIIDNNTILATDGSGCQNGSGVFRFDTTSTYNKIRIEGPGGGGGTFLDVCENTII